MQEALKTDNFKTLMKSSTGEFKDRGSKFIGIAYPAKSVEECKSLLEEVKKQYYDARHHCFAYRLDPENPQIRANDDGEPSNSAGAPIYNQLLSFDLWNVLVVVVRYFGGTKLGVSGLINAYKNAAFHALDNGQLKTEYILEEINISFPYKLMNDIMRLIKEEDIQIVGENMGVKAGYSLAVRKNQCKTTLKRIEAFHEVKIS